MVLVTGAGGRLGGRLAALLAPRFRVAAGIHHAPAPSGLAARPLDLTDPEAVRGALAAGVRAVVHCAALADVDACERDPDAATRLNVTACETLAKACQAQGAILVAVSTDQVLSGERPFSRADEPARPVSVYGRTKLEGEQAVLGLCDRSAVVRVALLGGRVHGPHPSCTEAVAWALRAGRPLRLFTDQHRTPVDPESVAHAMAGIIQREARGLFHLGGPERLSRHELGLRVAAVLGLDPSPIQAVRQADLAFDAPRAADASLDSSHARDTLGWEPRPLDEAIRSGRPDRD